MTRKFVSIPQRVQPWPRRAKTIAEDVALGEFPSLKGFNRGPDEEFEAIMAYLYRFPSLKGFNRGPD